MSSSLFIWWRKEKEKEKDEEMVIRLSFLGVWKVHTLVIMKGLLQHISHRDRVPPLEGDVHDGRFAFNLPKSKDAGFSA